MATTTNYGWTTPDDTALVKDGASAIRTLGTAIDTTTFNNAAAAIAKTIVDAKGDIIAATAADTVSRLAVGANGTVLTAASGQATGLEWATPAGGYSTTLISTTTLSGASTTISSIPTTYSTLLLVGYGITATAGAGFTTTMTINGASTGYAGNTTTASWGSSSIGLGTNSNAAAPLQIRIDNAKATTGNKFISGAFNNDVNKAFLTSGILSLSAAITSITISISGTTFNAGTIQLIGM